MSGGFVSSAASAMVTVWVLTWGIRRQGDLDYRLDANAKRIRWSIVAIATFISLGLGPKLDSIWCAAIGWLVATAFLAWPNFAYHLAKLFKRSDTTKEAATDKK